MPSLRIEKNCKQCQKLFMAEKAQLYCSFTCGRKAISKPKIERKCEICDKMFLLRPSQLNRVTPAGKYCSKECRNKGHESNIECKCQYCEKLFFKKQWEINQDEGKYCNKQCWYDFKNDSELKRAEFYSNIIFEKSNEGCWIWAGNTDKNGYGKISINNKNTYVHRYSYELHIDNIPIHMFGCHSCDRPACCNPWHIFIGTHTDNMHDMINKGRAGWQKKKQTTES